MVVLAPHGEVAKSFPLARLTHMLLVSVDAVAGLELLAKILQKTIGNCAAKFCPG